LKNLIITKLVLVLLLCGSFAQAQTLKGSAESIDKQYRAARAYGYAFVNTSSEVRPNVNSRQLVLVNPDRYLELHDVSYPYAVAGTKLFLNRLSAQYYSACGEKLTVTSLLRPRDRQPANAVAHSVHPTGMAADLRVPSERKCEVWLERTLLSLERQNIVDVTREHYPPHFHVAVFAKNYETTVADNSRSSEESAVADVVDVAASADSSEPAIPEVLAKADSSESAVPETVSRTKSQASKAPLTVSKKGYVVRKGDTLSEIADRTGVRVSQLRMANRLRGNLISAGQTLRIPTTATVARARAASKNDVVAVNEFTHRVNRGDTLWTIANRYGTSVQQLRRANSKASDSLQVGQVLKISRG
jgi:LysM repeat protein